MSLPVYYDSDLAGLTDSLWGREAVKENERGKADPTKDAPSPLPELKLMHGALLSTSQLGRNRWVKVVTPFSPRPQQNVKFSTMTKAWACIFSACHVHTFQKISWVMLHWENISYTTVHVPYHLLSIHYFLMDVAQVTKTKWLMLNGHSNCTKQISSSLFFQC